MNAETAGHAGTPQLKQFLMVNIKELRKRNRAGSIDGAMLPDSQSDQAISKEPATAGNQRSPGPGLKQQAVDLKINLERVRKQYTSDKHQATSSQASSDKPQAPSHKRQASSRKRQAHES